MPVRALVLDAADLGHDPADVLAGLDRDLVLGLLVRSGSADGPVPPPFSFRLAAEATGVPLADPRTFLMAASAAGCHPGELVAVGRDLHALIAPARAVGARAVWLSSAAEAPPGTEADASIPDLGGLRAVLARFEEQDRLARDRIGLGPHPRPWPEDPRLDPVLLAGGDRRNVVDRYRYWREDAIVADLDRRRHPLHIAIENWQHDRNIGAVVRNANAFNVSGVHIIGRRRWNRRGAMATDRYLSVEHHDTVAGFLDRVTGDGLAVVAVDNVPGAQPIERISLPHRCVLVFGQEGPGLSEAVLRASDLVCAITQFGSTRSLNAGVASGIAMHVWVQAHAPSAASISGDPAR